MDRRELFSVFAPLSLFRHAPACERVCVSERASKRAAQG